jgi:hypothetical protein
MRVGTQAWSGWNGVRGAQRNRTKWNGAEGQGLGACVRASVVATAWCRRIQAPFSCHQKQ